jgi:cysteine desulfurase
VHGEGRAARRLLEQARDSIAAALNAAPEGLVFCSGGTEADAMAVHGLSAGRRILIGATEHDAIRAATPHAEIVPVDPQGVIRLDALEALLRTGAPALLCLMLANNETGTIQPIARAAALCRTHGALLHVDAAQAPGRIAVDCAALGANSLAISSHKLGGPAGIGALLLDQPALTAFRPLIQGGGQELGRRGGTQPIALIAGFAAAIAAPRPELAPLRDAIEHAALSSGAIVMAATSHRLPNTTCLALPGVPAQTQLIALDLAGIAVSAGAACSSGKVARSHVLAAMGHTDLAGAAIRVSLPWNADPEAVPRFAQAYAALAARTRRAA